MPVFFMIAPFFYFLSAINRFSCDRSSCCLWINKIASQLWYNSLFLLLFI